MNIIEDCRQKIIDAYNQCIELSEKNNVHIFVWSWNQYSTDDLYKYETLDEYIDAHASFKRFDKTTNLSNVDCFITCVMNADSGVVVTEEELNKERKVFETKRNELIAKYGTLEELNKKVLAAKEKYDAAFDAFRELDNIKRGISYL